MLELETILGDGGMLLNLARDWVTAGDDCVGLGVVLIPFPLRFTKGKVSGATNLDDTGDGDGAGDNGGKRVVPKDVSFCENSGVAAGLGVVLKDDPTLEFNNPEVVVVVFVFCVNGTKTEDLADIY